MMRSKKSVVKEDTFEDDGDIVLTVGPQGSLRGIRDGGVDFLGEKGNDRVGDSIAV